MTAGGERGEKIARERVDNFTDGAFAFAVTLLVIGGGNTPQDFGAMRDALARVPVFAMGFALIALFWHGHVRWRRLCGGHDGVSVVLTLLMIFLVLVYVYPLQLMAAALVAWVSRDMATTRAIFGDTSLADLFVIYGAGFSAMAATLALLFWRGRRTCAPDDVQTARVETGVWSIQAVVGLLSMALTQVPALAIWAGMVYATLGIAIPLWVRVAQRKPAAADG
jgi:uncharacterized membrane protein